MDAAHQTINQLRRLRKQAESWEGRAKANEGEDKGEGERDASRKRVVEAAGTLKEKLTALEGELVNPDPNKAQPGPARLKEKLTTLSAMVDESDDAPTQGSREVFALLSEQVGAVQKRLRELLDGDVAAFNELVRAAGLPPVGE